MSTSNSSIQIGGSGVGFSGLLFIVFLVLKLTGSIAWSWWWVTAPLWAPFFICLTIAVVLLVIVGLISIVQSFF